MTGGGDLVTAAPGTSYTVITCTLLLLYIGNIAWGFLRAVRNKFIACSLPPPVILKS